MKTTRFLFLVAVLALVAGCSDTPVSNESSDLSGEQIPYTGNQPQSDFGETTASLGGSSTTPLSLNGQNCTTFPAVEVTITYTITGRQDNPASFDVNTKWVYNGTSFVGSVPTTVDVPARAAMAAATIRTVNISVENGTTGGSGATSFTIVPFNTVTSSPAALSFTANSNVTVHVAFTACTVSNTEPTLTLPNDMPIEATSSAGAVATYLVTAADAEDGDLTSKVSCSPASGSTFPLGETTVNCSVTDDGGLTATGSFEITVVDTTPPVLTCNTPAPAFLLNQAGAEVSATAVDLVSGTSTVKTSASTSAIGSQSVNLTATDEAGNDASKSCPYSVSYKWDGFFRPVDNPDVLNEAKAGQAIPLKWRLLDANDSPVTNLANVSIKVQSLSCGSSTATDLVEEYASGASGLQNLGDGYYQFNWKSPTTYANSCRSIYLDLGETVAPALSPRYANFKFKK